MLLRPFDVTTCVAFLASSNCAAHDLNYLKPNFISDSDSMQSIRSVGHYITIVTIPKMLLGLGPSSFNSLIATYISAMSSIMSSVHYYRPST